MRLTSITISALASLLMLSSAWFIYDHTWGLKVNHHTFKSPQLLSEPIRIAFITDLHLTNSSSDFERLGNIIKHAHDFAPDLILHGGDFTGEDAAGTRLIREDILSGLQLLTEIAPNYAILGNHEWWTDSSWALALNEADIRVIEGGSDTLFIKDSELCLRGLGDAYTSNYIPTPFHETCQGIRITLTHDPLAIQLDDQGGLYLAGHTHCGQFNPPALNPWWSPTNADSEFLCGLGSKDDKLWLVSAGVGTSVLPLRWGAPAGIEFITIR